MKKRENTETRSSRSTLQVNINDPSLTHAWKNKFKCSYIGNKLGEKRYLHVRTCKACTWSTQHRHELNGNVVKRNERKGGKKKKKEKKKKRKKKKRKKKKKKPSREINFIRFLLAAQNQYTVHILM